jgi:hypothetical protein
MNATTQTQPATSGFTQPSILQDLWDVKAKLNAEAGYNMERLIAIVRRDAAPYIDENGRVRVPTHLPINEK